MRFTFCENNWQSSVNFSGTITAEELQRQTRWTMPIVRLCYGNYTKKNIADRRRSWPPSWSFCLRFDGGGGAKRKETATKQPRKLWVKDQNMTGGRWKGGGTNRQPGHITCTLLLRRYADHSPLGRQPSSHVNIISILLCPIVPTFRPTRARPR